MSSRKHIHEPQTAGERLADAIAAGMGSWRFIIIQSAIVVLWIASNVWLLAHPFDPYPMILLNLLFSTQAAYAAPVIMMSQNRQAAKDRMRDDHEAQEVDALMTLNTQQLEILRLLHQIAAASVQPSHVSAAPAPPLPPPIKPKRARVRTPRR